MDVGTLSSQVTFKLVSCSLQTSIRFFHSPNPTYLSTLLTLCLPYLNGDIWVAAGDLDRHDLVMRESGGQDPVGEGAGVDLRELDLAVRLARVDGRLAAPIEADQRRGGAQVARVIEPDVAQAAAGQVVDRIDARLAIREEVRHRDRASLGELGAKRGAVDRPLRRCLLRDDRVGRGARGGAAGGRGEQEGDQGAA